MKMQQPTQPDPGQNNQQQMVQQQISQQQISQQQITQQQITQQQMVQQQMAQQQMAQQQMAQQQITQQQNMMYYPVRLVYETQIMMPPGEQMQPNQTIFLQQQNLPPWVQNRSIPAQNQVIYVHQPYSTNQIGPSIQQAIDPNQMFIQQNYPNIQQIIPNTMMTQNVEQIRPTFQIANVPQNIIPNVQIGLQQNQQMPVERMGQMLSNYAQVTQNVGSNILTAANTSNNIVNVIPNTGNTSNSVNDRQIVSNIQTNQQIIYQNPSTIQRTIENIKQEFVKPPQVNQMSAPTTVRPQSVQGQQFMTLNPIQYQNIQQNVPVVNNVSQTTQTSMPINRQNKLPTTIANVAPTTQMNEMNTNKPNITHIIRPNTMNTVLPTPGIRSSVPLQRPTFRTIKPRPQNTNYIQQPSVRPNQTFVPMHQTEQAQNYVVPNTTFNPGNVQRPNLQVNNVNYKIQEMKTSDSPTSLSRKRKSESPDEVSKKIVVNSVAPTTYNPLLPATYHVQGNSFIRNDVNKVSDVGVNTSPTHKIDRKPNKETISVTSLPNKEPLSKQNVKEPMPIDKMQQVHTNKEVSIKVESNVNTLTEKDKLVRNTVYTQARGRLLNDKVNLPASVTPDNIVTSIVVPNNVVVVPNNSIVKPDVQNKPPNNNIVKSDVQNKPPNIVKIEKVSPNNVKSLDMPLLNPETQTNEQKNEEVVKSEIKNVNKEQKNETFSENTTNAGSNDTVRDSKTKFLNAEDIKGKEIHMSEGHIKKEDKDNYILTHVLDGFVIQESNVAFPIRKPLKEKTIHDNKHLSQVEQINTEKEVVVKDNSKILQISNLDLNEYKNVPITDEVKSEEEKTDKVNPFSDLKPDDVKSWTVDQLASHLSKYQWKETIALLQEHEIDGESLFLVTKQQLITIGASEDHAEAICEFVKS